MVWAIVVVAIAVLGVAAWVGTGRLGEMPQPVSDRPKSHIPDGPVDQAFLDEMSLPRAVTGYRRSQVDAFLASHVSGEAQDPDTSFDVVRGGYDMQVVDTVLDRVRRPGTSAVVEADTAHGVVSPASPDTALPSVTEPDVDATVATEDDGETVIPAEPQTAKEEPENDAVESARGELPAP